jgi:HlyD family secretion protein
VPSVPRDSVVVETVKDGRLRRQVSGPGLLVPEDQRWLTAMTAGRVERVERLPGDAVEADTVVVTLSNPEIDQLVADARLELRASEAEFAALRLKITSDRMQQRVRAEVARTAAESARLQAEAEAEAARSGAVSVLQSKRSQLDAARFRQQYEMESELDRQLGSALDAGLRAQAAKQQQKAQAAQLRERQQAALQVRAGVPGLLQAVLVQEGQQVAMGANVARVARPGVLIAQLRVPESQAKEIRIGQKARIDLRGAGVDGSVMRVSPAVEQGTVLVEVRPSQAMTEGARADASVEGIIEIEVIENAIFVARPAGSLPNQPGSIFRLDVSGEEATRVHVQFGSASVAEIVVAAGLEPGDRIVVNPSAEWDGYDRIAIE